MQLLQQRGILDEAEADTLAEQEPLLAALSAAIQGRLATAPRADQRVRRLQSDPIEGLRGGPLCFSARGFSLHTATRIAAEDRAGLERLCRYVRRPALAVGRLSELSATMAMAAVSVVQIPTRPSHLVSQRHCSTPLYPLGLTH